jgi:hypothetical protein
MTHEDVTAPPEHTRPPAPTGPATADGPAGFAAALPRLLGVLVGLAAVLTVMLLAFGLPATHSGPHHVPLGVAGPPHATDRLAAELGAARGGEAWDVRRYPDGAALVQAVKSRDVSGGLAVAASGVTVYTATAGGVPGANAVKALAGTVAAKQRSRLTTTDVVPFPADDPTGAGLTAAALPMLIGGLLPAAALARLFPGHASLRIRATGAVLFALLAGTATAAVLSHVFGTVDGAFWATALGLSLGMAALALPLLGLESLFGTAGLGAGAALMVLLGNPLSALGTGPHWLPDGWSTLGQLLPPGAAGSLLRANGFFGGTGAAAPAAVLSVWAVAGLALMCAAGLRGRRGRPAA